VDEKSAARVTCVVFSSQLKTMNSNIGFNWHYYVYKIHIAFYKTTSVVDIILLYIYLLTTRYDWIQHDDINCHTTHTYILFFSNIPRRYNRIVTYHINYNWTRQHISRKILLKDSYLEECIWLFNKKN